MNRKTIRDHAVGKRASPLRRLLRTEAGGVNVFAAVVALPLVGFIGVSADAARAYLVKARLSTSVDAAALAGGKTLTADTYSTDVVKYFKSNYPPNFLGTTVTGPTFQKSKDESGANVIKVSASAKVPTAFMHLFGFDHLTVSAESEVTRKNSGLDVVIAMDMSGSMDSWNGGKKKIESAREAAKTLVNILYGDAETNELLKIGLVPWNGNVNIMLDTTSANPVAGYVPANNQKISVPSFTNPNTGNLQDHVWKISNSPALLLDEPIPEWKGCVYARYKNGWTDANQADDKLGYVGDWQGWEPREKYTIVTHTFLWWTWTTKEKVTCVGCTPCLNHGITPLNQSKSLITSQLEKLKSPTGNTDIPQGLSWSWRVLMNTEPFTEGTTDDENKTLVRAIVLLTDGANCSAIGDGYKAIWGNCDSYSTQKMDERAIAIANEIKKQGILVYTIQFGFNDATAAATLKKIASGNGAPYYQYAPNAAALQQVFSEIGTSLSELRLSK